MGINFVPVASTLVSAVRLALVSSVSVQYSFGKILLAAVQLKFAIGAKRNHFFGADREFDHAGVKVFDQNAVVLVVFRRKPERVGLDAQIDVLA